MLPHFNKVTGFQAGLQHKCFPVKLAEFLSALILRNICEQLFLRLLEMSKGRLFCARLLNVDDFQTATPKGKHIFGAFEELMIWE